MNETPMKAMLTVCCAHLLNSEQTLLALLQEGRKHLRLNSRIYPDAEDSTTSGVVDDSLRIFKRRNVHSS